MSDSEARPYVRLLFALGDDEMAWQLARHRVAQRARLFVDAGVKASAVAKVLGCSERTLYRRFAEAAALEGDEASELAAITASLAADDQAHAEARDAR